MAKKSFQFQMPKNLSPLWSWLKDHTVHIMVIVNGVILTFAMFWTVNMFITRMLTDDYVTSAENTKTVISSQFSNFEKSMDDFASYFASSNLNDAGELFSFQLAPQLEVKWFDSIIWVPAGNPKNYFEFRKKDASANLNDLSAPVIARQVNDAAGGRKEKFLFLSKSISSRVDGDEKVIQSRPLAIVQPVLKGGRMVGYLAGFSTFEKIISLKEALSGNELAQADFRHDASGENIYQYHDAGDSEPGFTKPFIYQFQTQWGGSPVSVDFVFKTNTKNIILELMPWLLAGFGCILTMIAWFYASNNFRKSRTLSTINAVLASKNDELNEQIREREKLFQTLRKSERENHAIINAISDIIFEVSPGGEVLFLNEAWSRTTGFTTDETMGRNLVDYILPEDADEQRRNIALLAKGQKTAYRDLTKLKTKKGSYRSVEIVVSMLRQDESKNLRVVGSFTDIEERQRAQQALMEAEKKYKTIWENAAGGIYQLTAEGKFLSANPALARIMGYENTDHLIRVVTNAHEELFVEPQARLQFLKNNIGRSQDPSLYESEAVRGDGRRIWVQENIRAVYDSRGDIQYYEGSIEDITERKESEVQLKAAKVQSDMASRAKSEFLANISHELRTPLNSIIGFSEIIKNEVFGPIEPKSYTEYAGNIFESGRHLLGIINQILDISRIDAGERELNESLVDIRKLCTTCLDLTRTKITQAGIILIDSVPDNLPKLVAEEVAIKQMMLNLLSNAIKFTPHGGRLTISAEMESGKMKISVTDTGAGMSEEQIERASRPFGLVDGRLDKSTGGAGLGLSLVHSLLKLHRGELEILSQRGIGTTASLIFPADRVQG